jgi:hypothetical protein
MRGLPDRSQELTFKLIDIALVERHPHERIASRMVGLVRAVLSEVQPGYAQEHEIRIHVWTETRPGMSDEDIEMALLMKASDIIVRVKARLEPGNTPLAAE